MKVVFELDDNGDYSIVRSNMMEDPSYAPYCGSVFPGHPNYATCSSPRMLWDSKLDQFKCLKCGWVTNFPEEFIKRYKKQHSK